MAPVLRIAHVDTERTWRGGENQAFSLIKGLSALGHSNLAVVRRDSAFSSKLKSIGQPVFEISPFGEWDFIAAHFLNRKLKSENINIVHAHSAHGAALAAFATMGTSIPVVASRRVDFHLSRNIFSRWKYSRARKILAISKKVKSVLIEDGIPEQKIALVPSGVDFSRFSGVTEASHDEMGVPPEALVIGQVAALAPHKDQVTFLKAFALVRNKNPKVHAVIVGEGNLRKELEALAKWLQIEPYVHFLGFREDALRFLAGFDIFCLSSKEEGLGTSILDSMALRVPVVATRVGGIPEMIENNVTGYLSDPHDPQKLADVLTTALLSKDNNRKIRDAALEKARQFDIQNTISLTEDVYFSLL